MTADFSSKTREVRRKWHNVFQVLKKGIVNPKYYTQWKYSSGIRGEI